MPDNLPDIASSQRTRLLRSGIVVLEDELNGARPSVVVAGASEERVERVIADELGTAVDVEIAGELPRRHMPRPCAGHMEREERRLADAAWARRGIAQPSRWQVSQLYDLACDVQRGEPHEVLALRRAQHERTRSSSTYRALRATAEALDAWPLEQDAARATLQRTDARGFVDALLGDHELELA